MTIVSSVILIILFFIVAYNILTMIFQLPDVALIDTYKRNVKKVKREDRLTRFIGARLKLDDVKRKQMKIDLQKAGIDTTPEMYKASIFTTIIVGGFISVLVFLFISKFISVGVILVTSSIYQQKYNTLVKRRKERIQEVETELPFFVRYFISQMKYTKDVAKIFKSYIDQQEKTPLTEDLRLTLSEMLSSSSKENMMVKAVENAIDRSDVEKYREFYRGILGVLKGENQDTFFLMLDRDMKALSIRNVEREGKKLPQKAKRSTWIVVGTFCLCMFTGFVQMILTAFSNL